MQAWMKFGKAALRQFKYYRKAAPLLFPRRVACNICGWQGKHLISDSWHKHSICPKCRSAVRHRLLLAALQYLEALSLERLVVGHDVLHFAPEAMLQRCLERSAARYITADCHDRRDWQLDMSDMSAVEGERFGLVIACDVLEHVADDRAALREVFRVLRPGGTGILTVPQQDGLLDTFEDPSVTSPTERERLFGQSDHLRIYGSDFTERLAATGFEVSVVDEHCFPAAMVQRHVLIPPERSPHPLATNFRKIFFARKPTLGAHAATEIFTATPTASETGIEWLRRAS